MIRGLMRKAYLTRDCSVGTGGNHGGKIGQYLQTVREDVIRLWHMAICNRWSNSLLILWSTRLKYLRNIGWKKMYKMYVERVIIAPYVNILILEMHTMPYYVQKYSSFTKKSTTNFVVRPVDIDTMCSFMKGYLKSSYGLTIYRLSSFLFVLPHRKHIHVVSLCRNLGHRTFF